MWLMSKFWSLDDQSLIMALQIHFKIANLMKKYTACKNETHSGVI